ncbi:MAG: FkbM family methyltransferase [Thermodesulfobacteriota bacterium]
MKKIKKEFLEIFLHITTLPEISMKGIYKKILLFLLSFKTIRILRNKYGPVIANRVIGDLTFYNSVYGTKIKMSDSALFEYYILSLRNKVHEPSLTLKFKNLFEESKSSVFVDIGAHYGFFSLLAGKWLEPDGKVISIEPNISFYKKLKYNITLNKLDGIVKTFNLGLSENESFAKMGGWNKRRTILNQKGKIHLVTFDSLCEKENIYPDIIKIDVHGAEGNILKGMPNILKNHVSHLFCELHEFMNGYNVRDIIAILEQAGLKVYEFTDHRSESGGQIIPISSDFLSNYTDRMIYATK